MTYQTQPGTLPHRVVQHLNSLPPGTVMTTVELCEALDAEPAGFSTSMANCVRMGVLKRYITPSNRRLLAWSLGDGVPPPEDAEPELAPIAPPRRQLANVVNTLVVQPPKTDKPIAPRHYRGRPAKTDAGTAAATDFRAALWTDGTLQIWRGEDLVLLTAREAAQLRQLLGARP